MKFYLYFSTGQRRLAWSRIAAAGMQPRRNVIQQVSPWDMPGASTFNSPTEMMGISISRNRRFQSGNRTSFEELIHRDCVDHCSISRWRGMKMIA